LNNWGYLPSGLPEELRGLFAVRCEHLHSGRMATIGADALRAVKGAYALLRALIGFPRSLFDVGAAITCRNEQDPLFKVFYANHLSAEPIATPPLPSPDQSQKG